MLVENLFLLGPVLSEICTLFHLILTTILWSTYCLNPNLIVKTTIPNGKKMFTVASIMVKRDKYEIFTLGPGGFGGPCCLQVGRWK